MACCSSIGRTLVVGASWAIVSSFRGAIVIQLGMRGMIPAEIRHLTPEFGFCSEAASPLSWLVDMRPWNLTSLTW